MLHIFFKLALLSAILQLIGASTLTTVPDSLTPPPEAVIESERGIIIRAVCGALAGLVFIGLLAVCSKSAYARSKIPDNFFKKLADNILKDSK